jgi:hypothetical protein
MMRKPLAMASLVALLLGGHAAAAAAAESEYGFAAGLGTLLAPTGPLGACFAFSASATPSSGGRRLVRARGELWGFATDGAWAALPTISGDVGLRLGRLDLYLTGGVELFGFAHRDAFTVFANFGLTAGAGVGVRLTPRLRLSARPLLLWAPGFAAAKLSGPDEGDRPNHLFLSGLLSLELIGGEAPDHMDFDEM